jgi:hypothetical protein
LCFACRTLKIKLGEEKINMIEKHEKPFGCESKCFSNSENQGFSDCLFFKLNLKKKK